MSFHENPTLNIHGKLVAKAHHEAAIKDKYLTTLRQPISPEPLSSPTRYQQFVSILESYENATNNLTNLSDTKKLRKKWRTEWQNIYNELYENLHPDQQKELEPRLKSIPREIGERIIEFENEKEE